MGFRPAMGWRLNPTLGRLFSLDTDSKNRCDQELETMQHLISGCPFSRQVWHNVLSWLRLPCAAPDDNTTSLVAWWQTARQSTPKVMHKGLASATLLVPWMIWKQRNSCVFDGAHASVNSCTALIKEEATLWAKAGALGLRALLPQTWDVH